LDQSIADSELSVAELNLVDARTEAGNAMLDLNEILGITGEANETLVDGEENLQMPLALDAQQLLATAYANRPDLAALLDEESSAEQLKMAERDLAKPTVQAMASAGNAPVRSDGITKEWYGAAGINVNIPLLNGSRFAVRSREAELAAMQAHARVTERRQQIERDLRKTLQSAQAAYQKIAVTEQLLEQADLALQLASTRYRLGLSNIVELNDAENAQIAAQIGAANARYVYRIWSAELRFQTGE
jgi:outer membrane protein